MSDSSDPVDCSPPGSSVHGIFQARILEWVAVSSSRESSQPRDWTRVSRIAGRRFILWATREFTLKRWNRRGRPTWQCDECIFEGHVGSEDMGDALVFFLWPIECLALYSGETRAARPWNKRFSCGPLLSLPLILSHWPGSASSARAFRELAAAGSLIWGAGIHRMLCSQLQLWGNRKSPLKSSFRNEMIKLEETALGFRTSSLISKGNRPPALSHHQSISNGGDAGPDCCLSPTSRLLLK